MSDVQETLSRTVLLVQRDVYPSLPTAAIGEHLASQRIRLHADERNVSEPAGQAAAIAFTIAAAQSGARLDIAVPDGPLAGPQPPLPAGSTLATGLRALCDALISPAAQPCEPVDLTVVLGDTPCPAQSGAICLQGSAFAGAVTVVGARGAVRRWSGKVCFGAHLAALAGAAECFREAMLTLGQMSGATALPDHRIARAGPARLVLGALTLPAKLDIGQVDFVSAGAMTNAALAPLLRIPGLSGQLRVIDADVIEASNLNRYALIDRSMIGMSKVLALSGYERGGLRIHALPVRLNATEPPGALAGRVMIGVDDIPSRWVSQARAHGWVCVGATSRTELLISEHEPDGPCAGCMHAHDEDGSAAIPTVSFVSQLAGVLQAYRLVANVLGEPLAAPTLAHGLALEGRRALLKIGQAPHPACPLRCAASRAAAA